MKKFFYFVLLLLSIHNKPFAQASLAEEDIINELKVGSESFTVLRDASDRNQWYYIQKSPTIAESDFGGQMVPDFSLIEYITRDAAGAQIAGGILNIATTLQLPATTIENLRTQISTLFRNSAVRLSALVPKDATVALYTPSGTSDSKLITTSVQGNGIAPTFSTQKMVFQIELTNLGSNIMQQMVSGTKGIPIAVTYTYLGLTPKKQGFKVTIDWDQTYNFYSREDKFRASASYYGLFGASYQSTSQKLTSDLLQNNCLQIEAVTGSQFTSVDLEKYLQPILTTINSEMLEFFRPPAAITPAAANDPGANGSFFSAGYSVAMKQNSQNKHGKQLIDFSFQQIIERKTIAGGLLGIGKYSDEIKEKLISVVQGGAIKTAYVSLPSVFNEADAAMMGLNEIDIKTTISGNEQSVDSKAQWKPGDKTWTVDDSFKTNQLAIPLGSVLLNNDMRNLKISTDVRIFSDYNNVKYTEETVASNEQYAVTALNNPQFDILTIDPSYLDYQKLTSKSKLISVDVVIKIGSKVIRHTFQPYFKETQWQIPMPIKFLLNRQDSTSDYSISINANLLDGSTKAWQYNDKDISKRFSNSITLLSSHFDL